MGIELRTPLDWFTKSPFPAFHPIKKELQKKLKNAPKQALTLSELPAGDQLLIGQIQDITRQLNVNNITRTATYGAYYRRHPEIEWAFLGHMVSRNGGWNMTDLRGEPHSRLLSDTERNLYFQFLERGNWLIFQDAYPQIYCMRKACGEMQTCFICCPIFMYPPIWKSCGIISGRAVTAIC